MKWLLKREFWEHRGGFLWAPVVAGAIFLFFTLLGGGTGQLMFARYSDQVVDFEGKEVPLSSMNWNDLFANVPTEKLRQLSDAINGITLMSAFWPLLVFGFVVFFYLLGALYDERRDRSVLFWKSLPVSDGLTVWSKLLTALLVAPLTAVLVALAVMLGFGILVSLFIAINGGNPFTIYWAQLRPFRLLTLLFSWIPIYMLWALPTAGWLMLCSAWARSKPFLWAVLVPLLAGVLVSWFEFFDIGSNWFWEHIVARLLTSAWPLSHLFGMTKGPRFIGSGGSGDQLAQNLSLVFGGDVYRNPSLWIGAAAGIAMILLAIRLRRWRDDA
ncbi:hypothetical protein EBB59_01105 [Lysobacter pythonis]|uniref:Uncharacterized protein n=1 Tax=Solilutibacter pythonis TaxID=2483112 RepID=A0A3M2I712_9GAMM|nr:hypothetical protein EBB59_01105 [Lysobacter pythonis]